MWIQYLKGDFSSHFVQNSMESLYPAGLDVSRCISFLQEMLSEYLFQCRCWGHSPARLAGGRWGPMLSPPVQWNSGCPVQRFFEAHWYNWSLWSCSFMNLSIARYLSVVLYKIDAHVKDEDWIPADSARWCLRGWKSRIHATMVKLRSTQTQDKWYIKSRIDKPIWYVICYITVPHIFPFTCMKKSTQHIQISSVVQFHLGQWDCKKLFEVRREIQIWWTIQLWQVWIIPAVFDDGKIAQNQPDL